MTPNGCVSDRHELDGYQLLANAIVTSAARDYKRTLRSLKRGSDYAPLHLRSLERFFNSAWYRLLTRVDSKYIKQEVDHETDMEQE